MTTRRKVFPVAMIGVGVAGLLFARHYQGTGQAFLRAHGANLSFTFAAVFLISLFRFPRPALNHPFASATMALLGVSAQEFAQFLRLYPGTFDPADFLWDAVGAIAGLLVLLARRAGSRTSVRSQSQS